MPVPNLEVITKQLLDLEAWVHRDIIRHKGFEAPLFDKLPPEAENE